MMNLLLIFAAGPLVVIACMAALNALTIPRLERHSPRSFLRVSLLVPARDESAHISTCVRRLLAQDYPDFELLVLDDASTDGTAELARAAGSGDERLQVLDGLPLPAGWLGKSWACQQLAERARGDLLIFTDADVSWSPGALRAVVGGTQALHADVISVWPTQISSTWSERLVVPLIMLAVLGYLPELLVRLTTWSPFAAANGQCLAFSRNAYEKIGGHAAVRQQVVEDVALARLARQRGLRQVSALGGELLSCRMYQGWTEVRRGFAKNILAGHGGRPALLLISAVFHWWIFIGPWVWMVTGWLFPGLLGWPVVPLLLIFLGVGARALTAATARQRLGDAALLPASVGLMTVITAQAFAWHFGSGPQWKGRNLSTHRIREEDL